MTAIPLDAKNPFGAFPSTTPVSWNIIPTSPMIEPPATSPEDRLTPFETFASLSSLIIIFQHEQFPLQYLQ